MPWYYFARREGKLIALSLRKLPPRPPDANPAYGDPLTPWYEGVDHFDADHVHLQAETLDQARLKAERIIKGSDSEPGC